VQKSDRKRPTGIGRWIEAKTERAAQIELGKLLEQAVA